MWKVEKGNEMPIVALYCGVLISKRQFFSFACYHTTVPHLLWLSTSIRCLHQALLALPRHRVGPFLCVKVHFSGYRDISEYKEDTLVYSDHFIVFSFSSMRLKMKTLLFDELIEHVFIFRY